MAVVTEEPEIARGAEDASASGSPVRRHWLGSLVSLVITLAVVALLLRLLNVGLPILYPPVLQGPFALTDVADAQRYTGFSPLVPFFHPPQLGSRPLYVTVYRRPLPRAVIFWQAEQFLLLDERRGGEAPAVPPGAPALPVTGGGTWWREGRTWHVVLRREGTWVTIETDLDETAVRRVAETLRPAEELR